MNAPQPSAWQKLLQAGLVKGEPPLEAEPESPWYVRAMLGLAGWIAAIFLLGFVAAGLAWVVRSDAASMIGGALLIAAAFFLLRTGARNDFAAQFALAVSFAGQALFTWGLFDLIGKPLQLALPWALLALLQAGLALTMPSATHRAWSAFAAAVAFYPAMHMGPAGFLASPLVLGLAAWLWLNEFRWPQFAHIVRPAAFGLVLGLLAIDMANEVFQEAGLAGARILAETGAARWLEPLANGAVLLWVVWRLLRKTRPAVPGHTVTAALAGAALLALLSLKAPGIAIGVTIVLLGHAHGNRPLTALGIIGLLGYAASYYYNLDTTLLVKSEVLGVTGAALLLARWLVKRRQSGAGETVIQRATAPDAMPNAGRHGAVALAAGVLILIAINVAVAGREQLLAHGRTVYLELAPVDPRSLMQGDYMALNYRIANEARKVLPRDRSASRRRSLAPGQGRIVASVDERSIAHFERIDDGSPLAGNEIYLRYRVRGGRLSFATNAFLLPEGTASRYREARYGRFRVGADGDLILVALHDEKLTELAREHQ